MKSLLLLLTAITELYAQPPTQKPVIISRSAATFWEVANVKETEIVFSERWADGGGFDADYSWITITISRNAITLSGYETSSHGTPVKTSELAVRLETLLKTKAERVAVIQIKRGVPLDRILSVLAAAKSSVDVLLIPRK